MKINVEPYGEGLNYIILAERLISKKLKPYVVHLHAKSAVSASAFEFNTGATTALNEMGTSAVKLDVISASVDDQSDLSTGHLRAVDIWGINSYNNLLAETIALSGTTVTSATNSYKALNDMAGSLWGALSATTHDAKGNIDIGKVGKVTNEIARIPANANNYYNTILWIPKNWRARIVYAHCGAGDTATGRSTAVLMFPQYYDALNQGFDGSFETFAFFHESSAIHTDAWEKTYGSDSTMSKLSFFGTQINSTDTWAFHAQVLIWATHNLDASQNKGIEGLG